MSTTIRDIAREAGVSVATVSKVLHGGGNSIRVSETRAAQVREVAAKLNYVPNSVARNLRSGRSQTIGLVFEHFGSISAGPLYYVYMFDGITQILFKRHYRLTILPEIDTKNIATMLSDGRLDGVIWCKLDRDGHLAESLKEVTIPIVALNAAFEEEVAIPAFACDNEAGSRLVVNHLAELGHKRILFVTEHIEIDAPDSKARVAGFRKAMQDRGLDVLDEDVVTWDRDATEFADWWAQKPEHTAVYAWNEGVASAILLQARERGVEVPKHLSVVGFDSTAFCDTTPPPLTAVRQPIKEMAEAATKTLLRLIAGAPAGDLLTIFPCTLDVRQSTSRPFSKERP